MINDSRIRAALTAAITEPWGVPYQLCWPALSLIMLDPRIASCVRLVNESWPARLPKAALFGAEGLTALAADPLLHALLEAVPVSTIDFEHFLTAARHALLETATSEQLPDPADIAALPFYAALTRQCFINEYIFDCDDSERAAAAACRTKLLALLDTNAMVPPLLLLAVAAYFPLYTLPEPSRLLATNQSGPVDERAAPTGSRAARRTGAARRRRMLDLDHPRCLRKSARPVRTESLPALGESADT